jgi:PAS domain S-box-containing protein
MQGMERAGGAVGVWAKLVDAVPYTVYVYNIPDGRVELANRNVAADLGYSAEQVTALGDHAVAQLMHPDDRARLPQLLGRWEHAADGDVMETEYRLRHADGSWRWFLGRDTVLDRDEKGRVRRLVGTTLDITERVELETSLARAQTLEAVGRLAGGVAHDFNNLLTAIMANVALAQRSLSAGRPVASTLEHIEQIGRVADDAARLTRQLLTFARQQSSRPEVLDANAVLLELRPMLRRLIEDSVDLTWELDPDVPPITIDRASFTQVILNLTVNARDAMRSGPGSGPARIVVRTRAEPNRGRGLHLTVEDTGIGMSPEVARRIFDPFFTTKAPGSGTGLGLSTVYGIVRQCGASIDVHSEPGKGTRFVIVFPEALAHPGAHRATRSPRPIRANRQTHDDRSDRPRSGSILLVEDNPALAEATAAFLEDCGFRVRVAPDGETGLELFRAFRADLDLVISDVVMPHVSGLELARAVFAEKPNIRLLLWSGYPEARGPAGNGESDDLDAPPNAFRFTAKPLLPDELLSTIDELLARSSR